MLQTDIDSLSLVAEVGASVDVVRKEVEKARDLEISRWATSVNRDIPKLLVTPVITKKGSCGVQRRKNW